MTVSINLVDVQLLVRDVAARAINPHFQALRPDQISEKSVGEVVTSVDLQAERLLTEGLQALTPQIAVLGEEAAAADPGLLDLLVPDATLWLVDALDGTPAYVAGSPDHAVMVALVDGGETVAAVIYQPQYDVMLTAERGEGAYVDGVRLWREPSARPLAALHGGVLRRFLDQPTRQAIDGAAHRFGDLTPGSTCAGVEYPLIALGERDFLLFWRTLPWDHAAGALLVAEAGGVARRLDGSDYSPTRPGEGLLVAGDGEMYDAVLRGLNLDSLERQAKPTAAPIADPSTQPARTSDSQWAPR